ncbi:ferritin [bacterium]|nr:ferritin [bacterium]
MISKKLSELLNSQLNFEFYSAFVYLGMASAAEELDYPGFSNWLQVQFREEQQHALKFFKFLNDKEIHAIIDSIPKPKSQYLSIEEIFVEVLSHEEEVTRRIYQIADLAQKEKEHSVSTLLQIYINEQVEEEVTVRTLLKKLHRAKDDVRAMLILDQEASLRVFTENPLFNK